MADNFPTKNSPLSQGESPSLYDYSYAENVKKAGTDGGYEFRRRKFSRAPIRTIKTGFLSLPHSDFAVLATFYEEHQMDTAFLYYDYMFGVTRQMRFDKFEPASKTIGQNRMWDLKIEMSEV